MTPFKFETPVINSMELIFLILFLFLSKQAQRRITLRSLFLYFFEFILHVIFGRTKDVSVSSSFY